jgi:ATP-binding protein involved in chromosome partitioning
MTQRIKGISYIVAVSSGKGGVGKTTVSVNFALALAAQGARVGLFDADIYGPNVPLMLGVRRSQSAHGLLPIARAESEPYIPPLERYGLKVMSIGLLVGEADAVMPDPHDAGRIVTQTLRDVRWGELDYLIIDLPPGTGEPQHSLIRTFQIDGVMIVTTPQDLSLLDASRSLGMFRQATIPILGVVENMSYLVCPHCGERVEVFYRSDRHWEVESEELEILGRVPMDIAISRGIDSGHPLVQASPTAVEATVFQEIATKAARKLANKKR